VALHPAALAFLAELGLAYKKLLSKHISSRDYNIDVQVSEQHCNPDDLLPKYL